jgi:hypothetical protein
MQEMESIANSTRDSEYTLPPAQADRVERYLVVA